MSSATKQKPAPSEREQELEALLRILYPATMDVMWCALAWNDHNFTNEHIRDKCKNAAKALGFERQGRYVHISYRQHHINAIDEVNELIERIEKVLAP